LLLTLRISKERLVLREILAARKRMMSESVEAANDGDDALLFVPRHSTITEPLPEDVICGRGKSIAHPGNQLLATLIKARKEEYQKALRRDDKTRITFEIVQSMRQGPNPARCAAFLTL